MRDGDWPRRPIEKVKVKKSENIFPLSYVRADLTLNALNALFAIADFGRAVNGRAKAGTDGVSAFATLCKTFCFCCASSLSTQ